MPVLMAWRCSSSPNPTLISRPLINWSSACSMLNLNPRQYIFLFLSGWLYNQIGENVLKGALYGKNVSGPVLCPSWKLLYDEVATCRSETEQYGLAHRARPQKRPTAHYASVAG